jgi:hypothetical protein
VLKKISKNPTTLHQTFPGYQGNSLISEMLFSKNQRVGSDVDTTTIPRGKKKKETGSDDWLVFKFQKLGPEDPWTYAT